MKKYLLPIICIFAISFSQTFAQCTPVTSITHNQPGLYPDSSIGLPHAITGQTYTAVIQFKVLHDTTYLGQNVTIDNIHLDSISGLPTGFTKTCTPTSCTFPGNSNSCISLQGFVSGGMTGMTYYLSVYTHINGHLTSLGTQLPSQQQIFYNYYKIVVYSGGLGLEVIDNSKFEAGQNQPNPLRSVSEISYYLPEAGDVTLNVFDLLGNKVATQKNFSKRGIDKFILNRNDLPEGIYIYRVSYKNINITKRMIVADN